jgi:hypothetical protein
VACVKFLSDLELYGQDGGCPRCAEAAAEAEAKADKSRQVVLKLCVDSIVEVLEGSPKTGLAHMAAAVLDERQRQRIAELHTLRLDEIRAASADDLTREALTGA